MVDLVTGASSKSPPPPGWAPPALKRGSLARCPASSGLFWGSKPPGWPKVKLPLSSGAWSSMIRVPCRSGPSASTPTRSAPSARPERESTRPPQPPTLPLSVYRNDHRLSPHEQNHSLLRRRPPLPRVRPGLRQGTDSRLRDVLRTARGRLRLRAHRQGADPRGDRGAPAFDV